MKLPAAFVCLLAASCSRTPPQQIGDAIPATIPRQTVWILDATAEGREPLRMMGEVQGLRLMNSAKPLYPPLARASRIEGTVKFDARICADGHVAKLQLISGPPMLVEAAAESVRQWVYKPSPLEVQTTIDVNFTLAP